MCRQEDRWFLSCESLDALQSQQGDGGVVGDPIHLFGLQKSLRICRVSGEKVRHTLCPYNYGEVADGVSGSGDEDYAAGLCDGIRRREWAERRSIHLDQLGFQPYGPALRKGAPNHHPFQSFGCFVSLASGDNPVMREVIEAARVIVVKMGQNYCLDILGGIEIHRLEKRTDLFPGATLMMTSVMKKGFHFGRYPGTEFLAVSPVSTRKRPSGCSIRKQKIGTGPTHRLSRKMSILRWKADLPTIPQRCASFSWAVPV